MSIPFLFNRLPELVAALPITPAAKVLYADRLNFYVNVVLPRDAAGKRPPYTTWSELEARCYLSRRKISPLLKELEEARLLVAVDNPASTKGCKTFVPLYYRTKTDSGLEPSCEIARPAGSPFDAVLARHVRFYPVPVLADTSIKPLFAGLERTRFVDQLVFGLTHLFKLGSAEISKRLGIHRHTAKQSVLRLEKLKQLHHVMLEDHDEAALAEL